MATQGRTRLQYLRSLQLPDSELGPFWSTIVFAGAEISSAAQGQPVIRRLGTVWDRFGAASRLAAADALRALWGGEMLAC